MREWQHRTDVAALAGVYTGLVTYGAWKIKNGDLTNYPAIHVAVSSHEKDRYPGLPGLYTKRRKLRRFSGEHTPIYEVADCKHSKRYR